MREDAQIRLELIARNAEAWHHDAEAKQRALNVIARWARGGELPDALVTDFLYPTPDRPTRSGHSLEGTAVNGPIPVGQEAASE